MHLPPRYSLFVVLVSVGEYVPFYAARLLSRRPHPRDGGKASLEVRSHLLTLEREEVTVTQLLCTSCAFTNLFFTSNTNKIQVYKVPSLYCRYPELRVDLAHACVNEIDASIKEGPNGVNS